MSFRRVRRMSALAMVTTSALVLGSSSAGALPAVSLTGVLGSIGLTAGVGNTPVQTVTGQVAIYAISLANPLGAVPWEVDKNPSGCKTLPLGSHILLNTTNAPVTIYVDPFCATIGLTIPPGLGSHLAFTGSWSPTPASVDIDLGQLDLAAGVSAPQPDVAPVQVFVNDGLPLVNYDTTTSGCTPLPLAAHALFNNSNQTVTAYVDPTCQSSIGAIVIPPGEGDHVIYSLAWAYGAPTAAAAPTATKSSRTASCTRSARTRARTSRAKKVRICKTSTKHVTRPARQH